VISVEENKRLNAIEIHLDSKDIDRLIDDLTALKAQSTHLHLMTPSWGDRELSEETHGSNVQVNHLIIYSHIGEAPAKSTAAP
jgi:hypothetical protein